MKTLYAITAALLFAVVLLWGTMIDSYSDESAAANDAIAEHSAEIRMLRAAVEMCGGENAVAQDLGNGTVQCFTHRGFKTRIAKVTP